MFQVGDTGKQIISDSGKYSDENKAVSGTESAEGREGVKSQKPNGMDGQGSPLRQ